LQHLILALLSLITVIVFGVFISKLSDDDHDDGEGWLVVFLITALLSFFYQLFGAVVFVMAYRVR
jgi:hypothetical protein